MRITGVLKLFRIVVKLFTMAASFVYFTNRLINANNWL